MSKPNATCTRLPSLSKRLDTICMLASVLVCCRQTNMTDADVAVAAGNIFGFIYLKKPATCSPLPLAFFDLCSKTQSSQALLACACVCVHIKTCLTCKHCIGRCKRHNATQKISLKITVEASNQVNL